ncbi:unnamed protein product, partial [marine sediment metagenome]
MASGTTPYPPDGKLDYVICERALKLKQYKRIAELIDIQGNVDRAHERYRRDLAKPVPPGTTDEKYRAFERKAFVEQTV